MKLEDVVAERYSGFITIHEVILEISTQYQCTESEARHVLAEALRMSSQPPVIYERLKLGPSPLDSFDTEFILKSLSHPEMNPEEGLGHGIPF